MITGDERGSESRAGRTDSETPGGRRAHAEAFAKLVERARAEGVLRPRVSLDDVRLALTATTSARTGPDSRRLTAVLLTGLLR